MFQDCFGSHIEVGDVVCYATIVFKQARLKKATVLEVTTKKDNGRDIPALKVQEISTNKYGPPRPSYITEPSRIIRVGKGPIVMLKKQK